MSEFGWGRQSFEYVELDCPKILCDSAGRPNKSASEVWKSTVQVNSVNLVGWVLHSRGDVALWNLVCYPLLSLSLPNQLLLTPPPRPVSSSSWVFIPSLSSLRLTSRTSRRLTSSIPFFSLQLECFSEPETKQAAPRRGGCRRRWNVPTFLLQSPPSSHPQFTQRAAMVNPPTWTRVQHSWDPLPRTEETAFALHVT